MEKILFVLVGVPASGKSYYAEKFLIPQYPGIAYISTDHYVEKFAKEQGKTYSEVFQDVMSDCVKLMTEDVIQARTDGKNIVWDQTSTSVEARAKKLRMLREYKKIAIVFPTPDPVEHKKRLESRPGKIIPRYVMESMIDNLVLPTFEEDFDEIWTVGNQANVLTLYMKTREDAQIT